MFQVMLRQCHRVQVVAPVIFLRSRQNHLPIRVMLPRNHSCRVRFHQKIRVLVNCHQVSPPTILLSPQRLQCILLQNLRYQAVQVVVFSHPFIKISKITLGKNLAGVEAILALEAEILALVMDLVDSSLLVTDSAVDLVVDLVVAAAVVVDSVVVVVDSVVDLISEVTETEDSAVVAVVSLEETRSVARLTTRMMAIPTATVLVDLVDFFGVGTKVCIRGIAQF
mmetsp:Transcript_21616/g.32731  ORF Transcript_21616/g.32731 Transcript_21616/m.32731 type:complete len:224 (+) Transcript_21616:80-751(+)